MFTLKSYTWALSEQGPRPTQEDVLFQKVFEIENGKKDLAWVVGVADGHTGKKTSEFLKDYIPTSVMHVINKKRPELNFPRFVDIDIIKNEIIEIIKNVDKELLKHIEGFNSENPDSGAVLSFYVVYNSHILVFQIGDTKILIFDENGKCILQTPVHDKSNLSEIERVKPHGGYVAQGKFNFALEPSRVLGDLVVKSIYPLIFINDPEVQILPINSQGICIFAVTDGIDTTTLIPFQNYAKKICASPFPIISKVDKTDFYNLLNGKKMDNKTISFQSFTKM